jgi:hypothetical protein
MNGPLGIRVRSARQRGRAVSPWARWRPISTWSRLIIVVIASSLAMRALAGDDAVDPRYPGRYCFWYGSCPFSGAGRGECPAPYQDPGIVPDVVFGKPQSLLWGTERLCAGWGWKNLCCEPLGSVSQDEKASTPPPSHPANVPITITPRPADRSPALDQPVDRLIGPHPADGRPPLSQPSSAPITVYPADPSSLDLPVRKVIGAHPTDDGSASVQPANRPTGVYPKEPSGPVVKPGGPYQAYPSGPSAHGPPPFGQSVSTPIGPHPAGIPSAPGGGFDASKNLPPFGQPGSQPGSMPFGSAANPLPKAPDGVAVSTQGNANKSPGTMTTNTGGIYQVHPGGTALNGSKGISVKKDQSTKLGKSPGAATGPLRRRNSMSHRNRWRAAMRRYRSAHH